MTTELDFTRLSDEQRARVEAIVKNGFPAHCHTLALAEILSDTLKQNGELEKRIQYLKPLAELGQKVKDICRSMLRYPDKTLEWENIYGSGLLLARMAHQVNSEESTLTIEGVYEKATGEQFGSYQVTVKKIDDLEPTAGNAGEQPQP
jgi:hypothetical protein